MKLKIIVIMTSMMTITHSANASSDALAFILMPKQESVDSPSQKSDSAMGTTRDYRSDLGSGPASSDVARLADQQGIPRNLALSVCKIESRCRYGLVGRAGERGPMQIKLQTARGLGYNGTAAGLNGHAGAYWGVRHLAVAYRKCGTARGAAKLHNAGLASSCSGSGYASRVVAGL